MKLNVEYDIPMKQIQAAIRQTFSRSDLAKAARLVYLSTKTGPKNGIRYDCAKCSNPFPAKSTQVDHIEPVCPIGVREIDIPIEEFLARVYCDKKNLQVLCLICHQAKSKRENALREYMRKVNRIKDHLPEFVSLKQAAELYESLPEPLRKLSAGQIGQMALYSIRWFKKLIKKQ